MWNRQQITDLLLQAGEIALRAYRNPVASIKADGTIVTETDRAIEALFQRHFDRPEAGTYLFGEETIGQRPSEYLERGLREHVFIVDPIDGTVPYANHIPTWGISVGYAAGGTLLHGAIYLPVTRELFISDERSVYFEEMNGEAPAKPISSVVIEPPPAKYSVTGLVAITQEIAKQGSVSLPNPVHTICCAVLPISYLLLGRYLAYLANLKVWDLAGGLPLLRRLGFETILWSGRPLTDELSAANYNLRFDDPECWKTAEPFLIAPPDVKQHVLLGIRLPG